MRKRCGAQSVTFSTCFSVLHLLSQLRVETFLFTKVFRSKLIFSGEKNIHIQSIQLNTSFGQEKLDRVEDVCRKKRRGNLLGFIVE